MTSLRLPQILHSLFSDTDLNRVNTILLKSLDLCDLAPVNLDDGAWHDLTPLVPEMSHADLVTIEANSSALAISGSSLLQLKLLIDFVLEACE